MVSAATYRLNLENPPSFPKIPPGILDTLDTLFCKVSAQVVHAQVVYAQVVHAQVVYAQEVHVQVVHAQVVHAQVLHD